MCQYVRSSLILTQQRNCCHTYIHMRLCELYAHACTLGLAVCGEFQATSIIHVWDTRNKVSLSTDQNLIIAPWVHYYRIIDEENVCYIHVD